MLKPFGKKALWKLRTGMKLGGDALQESLLE